MVFVCTQNRYNFSFLAVSLRPEQSRIIAEAYLAEGDWNTAKIRVLASNALQCRGLSTSIRTERELRQRLGTLTHEQLDLLTSVTSEDRIAISWLAAIKYIHFAFDFVVEVLRDKLSLRDPILRYSDYETYVEIKSISHPELTKLSVSSKNKVRQTLFNMLTEAGLLHLQRNTVTITRPVLSLSVRNVILLDNSRWLAGFLFTDDEIGEMRCL